MHYDCFFVQYESRDGLLNTTCASFPFCPVLSQDSPSCTPEISFLPPNLPARSLWNLIWISCICHPNQQFNYPMPPLLNIYCKKAILWSYAICHFNLIADVPALTWGCLGLFHTCSHFLFQPVFLSGTHLSELVAHPSYDHKLAFSLI